MRALLTVATFLILMALAFWAYRENYETQQALREMDTLQREIGDLRDALALQRAEWAYLNRPERLRDLVTMNFERVPLLPLEPGQFQPVERVAMPPPPALAEIGLDGAVDVMGTLPAGEEDPL
jgi:hypothetical protein